MCPSDRTCNGSVQLISWIHCTNLGGYLTPGTCSIQELFQFLGSLPYILHVYNFRLIRPDTRLYDVTGKPISNSKSPPLYNKEFKSVGFDEVYVNSFGTIQVSRLSQLTTFQIFFLLTDQLTHVN
ncbi:putative shikimate dehydrogenase, 3-dehydroquinate dehydratase [Rosa chinensis]|uniref:Putative shikimate dehydrogenase, 3-dehydroquinate dehydratase n=1 Tax=Rosa chinensis TaxID=74649 RepID=A0A2P6SPA5_ROSCH|nr:putative shikimate dehydrogenase, 3-dehydroquinate dehydratase [Rosa chinensis]